MEPIVLILVIASVLHAMTNSKQNNRIQRLEEALKTAEDKLQISLLEDPPKKWGEWR
jgi:uncharacterized membrane protein YvbJ